MKILTIGSERNLFDKNSAAAKRILEYGELIEQMHIIVFTKKGFSQIDLSDKVHVYPTNSLTKLNYIFDAIKLGRKLFKKNKFDLISTQDPFESGFVGYKLKKKFNVGLNVQIHGDFFSDDYYKKGIINKIRFNIARKVLSEADSIRVVSQRIADSLKKFNISQDKIITIPIYVDPQSFSQSSSSFDLHQEYPGKFVILSVGRLVKEKNIELLIEAFSKVAEKHSDAVLVIVGEGDEERNLRSKIKDLKLSGKVFLKGWSNDIVGYYKSADLFVVSSDCEGYNRTVIEAMSQSCPVVITDVGVAGEVVKNEINGLIVKTNDADGLAKAINELIESPDLRNSFSKKGLETVQSLPTKEENLALYLKSWQMAVNQIIN